MAAATSERLSMARGGARLGSGRKPKSGAPKNFGRCLYVIQQLDDATACKIGVSVDPLKSLSILQRRNFRRLKLAGLFGAPSNSAARQIETMAKERMTEIPGSGWYRIGAEQVAAYLQDVARSLGLALSSEPIRELGEHGGRRSGAGRPPHVNQTDGTLRRPV
jgi:hypothetical protein